MRERDQRLGQPPGELAARQDGRRSAQDLNRSGEKNLMIFRRMIPMVIARWAVLVRMMFKLSAVAMKGDYFGLRMGMIQQVETRVKLENREKQEDQR